MTRPHIAVLDPAVHTPEIACFNRMSLDSPLPLTYHLPAFQGMGTLSGAGDDLKGIIILGSASSVPDSSLWQSHLRAFLEKQFAAKTPTLGICYGHQLIAHMMGGKVAFAYEDKRKMTGTRTIALAPTAIWGPTHLNGPLVVSHREIVTECPPNCKAVGKSREFAFEALQHNSLPIWTIQAHPEAEAHFLLHQKMEPVDKEAFTFGHRIVKGFLDYCAKTAR